MAYYLPFVIAAVVAYLLGSLSFAILVARVAADIDIRSKGSGNAGMTNVLRTLGKKAAVITFIGDFLKGALSVTVARWLAVRFGLTGNAQVWLLYLAAVCAVLGHFYPVYFRFRGGKGVATTCGCIFAINLPVVAVMGVLFGILVLVTRIVSLSSIWMMASCPVLTALYSIWLHRPLLPSVVGSCLLSGMVVAKHHSNIKRLMAGTEYRFGQKKS